MTIARLQAKGLQAIFEGADKKSAGPRLELIGQCAAMGIGRERIAQADRAVFWELTKLVAARFRTSPRNRSAHGQSLRRALDRLATDKTTMPPNRSRSPAIAYAH